MMDVFLPDEATVSITESSVAGRCPHGWGTYRGRERQRPFFQCSEQARGAIVWTQKQDDLMLHPGAVKGDAAIISVGSSRISLISSGEEGPVLPGTPPTVFPFAKLSNSSSFQTVTDTFQMRREELGKCLPPGGLHSNGGKPIRRSENNV